MASAISCAGWIRGSIRPARINPRIHPGSYSGAIVGPAVSRQKVIFVVGSRDSLAACAEAPP